MPAELRDRIRKALRNASSQKPVPERKLVGLGAPDEVRKVLAGMYAERQVNNCSITRNGITETVWWPTGVIALPSGPQGITINQSASLRYRQLAAAAPAKPITEQEKDMAPATSNLRTTLYDKIVVTPGILRTELVKHALEKCPGTTEKLAVKTIGNLVTAKKIRLEGKRDEARCHLNVGVSKPEAPAAAASAAPRTPRKKPSEKKAAARRSPAASKAAPEPAYADRSFTVMLDDESFLHIVNGDQKMVLNPVQVDRLSGFIDRMGLAGRAG
jgi:hypothetical protein